MAYAIGARPLGPRRIAECAALNLGSAYCFGVAGLVLFGGWCRREPRTRSFIYRRL